MKISVIVCAYNEEKYIGKTLQSILDAADENLLELIVVDNASTDKTAEVARSFKNVKLVSEPKKGLTKARQAGLTAASGDVLSYLDADTLVNKQWWEVLKREFTKNPELSFLSGPYHYYDLPGENNRLLRMWANMWVKIWHWFVYRIAESEAGFVIMGGNFAATKANLLKVGGFDSSIEFYGEDTDIGRRLNKLSKSKFLKDYYVETSARRFKEEGIVMTGIRYLINYLSIVVFKRPVTASHGDIR
jgi:glycosyltransferase involved in cell wall biosynthesis